MAMEECDDYRDISVLHDEHMSKISHLKKGGYTLIEMIVTIGLVSLLLLAIVNVSFSIGTSHRRARTYLEINSSALSAFSRFSRDIRRASSVDVVNSTLGASSGRIVLNMKKDDGSNDVTTFYLAGDRVREIFNGNFMGDITPGPMNVSNLTFRLFATATSTAVRVEMTVAPDDINSLVPAVNFYGTYVLRGSYIE